MAKGKKYNSEDGKKKEKTVGISASESDHWTADRRQSGAVPLDGKNAAGKEKGVGALGRPGRISLPKSWGFCKFFCRRENRGTRVDESTCVSPSLLKGSRKKGRVTCAQGRGKEVREKREESPVPSLRSF